MQILFKNTPRPVVFFVDLFTCIFALLFSYFVRFDLKADKGLIKSEWEILSKSILIYIAVRLIIYLTLRIQKSVYRHTNTVDIERIALYNLICFAIFFVLGLIRNQYFDGYYLFPTTVLVLDCIFSFIFMLCTRFVVKVIYLESLKPKDVKHKVLIYGAGISGLITKRTIEKEVILTTKIVGFIDDDKRKVGTVMEGVTIYSTADLNKLIEDKTVDQVILAIQKPDEENKARVLETCVKHNVSLKKVPVTTAWVNGEFSTKQIQNVRIEDLLGRKSIHLEQDLIREDLHNRVVLVTGAAGSIGSGMVTQILEYQPKQVILLDNAESGLYDLMVDLKAINPFFPIVSVIADIRSKDRIKKVFNTYKPEYILHAAAYKHVPLMEEHPSEAIRTNVQGTMNLVDLAKEYHALKFVMISTDKAVNPTNVMGASKRIAEMYAQYNNSENGTKFITTRFGNVLGSNGSVIPLFKKQIENGGPVTVTDERITRFFMTIPEACQLVLQASTLGQGGEIFVFDMGESVRIIDLAQNMIKLSGLELGKDIEIKVTGLRPGEKLYEELLSNEETTLATPHPKILRAQVKSVESSEIDEIKELIQLFEAQDNFSIVAKMKTIVPEYISNNSIYSQLDK